MAEKRPSGFAYKRKKGRQRLRVCFKCYREGVDDLLGWIHSEDGCDRCKKKPCAGYVVQGTA